jgi:hemerythrin superfamily protein
VDAITLLKADHKAVAKLFREYKAAQKAGRRDRTKIVGKIIEELSMHAAVEEQVFYPAVRAEVPALEDDILESLEEHHVMKWTLAELAATNLDDERYDAKVTVLIEEVRHHVEEEEQDWFPEVREALGRARLRELGDELAAAKKKAPRAPEPERVVGRLSRSSASS